MPLLTSHPAPRLGRRTVAAAAFASLLLAAVPSAANAREAPSRVSAPIVRGVVAGAAAGVAAVPSTIAAPYASVGTRATKAKKCKKRQRRIGTGRRARCVTAGKGATRPSTRLPTVTGAPPFPGSGAAGTPPPGATGAGRLLARSAPAARSAQSQLYTWLGWEEPFWWAEYGVPAAIAVWKYNGCTNAIYKALYWFRGSTPVYSGIAYWADYNGRHYTSPPC